MVHGVASPGPLGATERLVSTQGRDPLPLVAAEPLVPPASFAEGLGGLGVTLDAGQTAQLGDYLARLLAMNESLNLTAIVDPDAAWTRHALDALSLVPHLQGLPAGATVLDVGSGGGVPGIPLAIARPDLSVMLLEATQKKAQFLTDVSAAVGLVNVEVVAERAEVFAETNLARSFDAVTARAVARIEALLPWTAPFAKPGGRLLFIKGQKADEELRAAKKALGRFRAKHLETKLTTTGRVVVLRVGNETK